MTPMRTVSACAWAKRQSRLRAAAAAAEFFRSVRRDVFIAFLPRNTGTAYRRRRRHGQNDAPAPVFLRPVLRAVLGLSIWRTGCNVNAAIWPHGHHHALRSFPRKRGTGATATGAETNCPCTTTL